MMLDANKARGDLKDILEKREYQVYYDQSKGLFQRLWESAKEWLAKKLEKLFPALESAGNAAGPVLIIVITAVIILLGIAVFLIIRHRRRTHQFKERKPLQSIHEINWTYQRHLQEAESQEKNGEFSRAARHLFLALLLYCHEKSWLEAKIWKTNWDYYEELKKVNRPFAEQFFNLAAIFDQVAYGEHQISKDDLASYRADVMKWLQADERGHQETE